MMLRSVWEGTAIYVLIFVHSECMQWTSMYVYYRMEQEEIVNKLLKYLVGEEMST